MGECQRCKELEQQLSDFEEIVMDTVHQACYTSADDKVDSMAISAYANALRVLAERGKFVIEQEHGRRVIGRWKEDE